MIHYRNDVRASGVDGRALRATAQRLLRETGEAGSSLSLTIVGDRAMQRLNREHRGKDRPTDVLSFPLHETLAGGLDENPERLLGDVVISVETARRQAADYDAPLQDELYRLLIHGLLHVMGHDHELPDERARMERAERALAAAIGLRWPYEEAG